MHEKDRGSTSDDQDDSIRTGSVVDRKKAMFVELIKAAYNGHLALVKGTIKETNEEVAVICIAKDDGEHYQLYPLGHLCNEDPFKYYIPDLEDIKNEGVIM
jgi:hypothetical protein